MITSDLVKDSLNSIDRNSSMGDDAIHPSLLVILFSVLADPLSIFVSDLPEFRHITSRLVMFM